ncbi:Transposase IS116/IS110/IS902 family protein [Bacillus sp. OV166]|uniref:IS110 family transposase n=1 Tax=Bacillus sp. OV166 TaxID=1882763 RepID=UPI000A2AAFBB|nr:IS110 family transposase [Bacillus sp. OV166]SMQ64180.1 Transposase IS116/IS110/IS902 family protein [Bacillus sp. OV166]
MNPVVGLDVAKGESEAQAFLDKDKPFGKSFSVSHTKEGLDSFISFLKELKRKSGIKPAVILESTGHYHTPIIQCLEENQYLYILVNPIISYQAKKTSLRKVKTDAVDAHHLCILYYKVEFEPYKKRGERFLNLRTLSRQYETVTNLYVQTKLQFHTILDQVFPEYRGVFGDLFSKVSLKLLKEFPTSEDVLLTGIAEIIDRMEEMNTKRSRSWIREKAVKLLESAERNPFHQGVYESQLFSLDMYITMLLQYQDHLSNLETQIDDLAEEIEECKIIQSIPGIGEKIAATIISEIGEIDRFNHLKKLVAYAGIDPSVHSSGKFTATINHITIRGSSRLRHALYMAVLCGIRSSRNKKLKEYYDRKRNEGKPSKVAMIAGLNKLLHWIYAILKSNEQFLDLA